jgi:hypothetical protein
MRLASALVRVRARMAVPGGCLSEHVELVNLGVADRSRGLQTVRLSRGDVV